MAERISSNPEEQARYEIYAKGFDAGVECEQERIIALLEKARDIEPKGIASWLGLQSALIIIKENLK